VILSLKRYPEVLVVFPSLNENRGGLKLSFRRGQILNGSKHSQLKGWDGTGTWGSQHPSPGEFMSINRHFRAPRIILSMDFLYHLDASIP
jgi:hypothetical protein